mmetsp:Transcript_69161/g.193315  ORF Transcript_69161/g.193315 Transcript_69161/m.193315 type:complete len:393 (+) Transcript_69161:278-1456(+)
MDPIRSDPVKSIRSNPSESNRQPLCSALTPTFALIRFQRSLSTLAPPSALNLSTSTIDRRAPPSLGGALADRRTLLHRPVSAPRATENASPAEGVSIPSSPDVSTSPPTRERSRSIPNQLLCHACRRVYRVQTSNPSACPRCGSEFFEFQNLQEMMGTIIARPSSSGGAGGSSGLNPEELLFNMVFFSDQGQQSTQNLNALFESTENAATQVTETMNAANAAELPASQEVVQYLKDSAVKSVMHHDHTTTASSLTCGHERKSAGEEAKIEEQEHEIIECPVCAEDIMEGEDIVCLPACKHHFHLPCILQWLEQQSNCPMCRRAVCAPHPDDHDPCEDTIERAKNEPVRAFVANEHVAGALSSAVLSVAQRQAGALAAVTEAAASEPRPLEAP